MDLNDLIDPALGVTLTVASGINDNGQIVAGRYLLTPVPEPEALPLLAGGLAGLLGVLRMVRRART
jgi:hypothetical protein